ncbi:MAG: nuclear transport factor 2 family protein [Saprospiraceae bacterium]
MKRITLPLLILLSGILPAQNDTTIQAAIDQQVWKPFIVAFKNQDAELFNSIHTDDVLRITPWGIKEGKEYKASTKANYEKGKAAGQKRTIAFWFEHRQAKQKVAYEVGYYKVTAFTPEGEQNYYARFHVLLRKKAGRWKIAQDWDTNQVNGVAVTAEDFEKGADKQLK